MDGQNQCMDKLFRDNLLCHLPKLPMKFYKLDSTNFDCINKFLSSLVERGLFELECSYCIEIGEDNREIQSCTLGKISSYYYIHHLTVRMFRDEMRSESTFPELIEILANAHEYSDLPVRHNEDQLNSELAQKVPLPVNVHAFDSSNTKTHILLQAHFCQIPLPSTDYNTDTKSVLDQAIRILQAMLDVSADNGWLTAALRIIVLIQMVVQGKWYDDSPLLILPHVTPYHLCCFRPKTGGARRKGIPGLKMAIESLPELLTACEGKMNLLLAMLEDEMEKEQIDQLYQAMSKLPLIDGSNMYLKGYWEGTEGQQEKHVNTMYKGGKRADDDWIQVHADQEYVLQITLSRLNKLKKYDSKAFTPKFPKPKDEGWILVLGDVEAKEVIALKRVSYVRGRTTVQLAMVTPESTGRAIYTLYLMSDSYLGLDQQYDICLDVVPASLECQVNTEVKGELDFSFSDDDE